MLVLSRKKDQRIVIAGGIVLTILEIRGDKVRVGIEAPKHVDIHREEVWQAIAAEQGDAAGHEYHNGNGATS